MSGPTPDENLRRLEAHLTTRGSQRWAQIEWMAQTGSTNADLMARAKAGQPGSIVLVADHQSAGRGRLRREWQSPPGANLLVSILVHPRGPVSAWPRVSSALALAAVDSCRSVGVEAAIKWPNDLLVGEHKVSGMLAEALPAASALVLGIGINVAWPTERHDQLRATSLAAESAQTVERVAVLGELLAGFESQLDRLGRDPSAVVDEYEALCSTLGQEVRISLLDGAVLQGVAVGLGGDGSLVVETANGTQTVAVGDVEHLRPAG